MQIPALWTGKAHDDERCTCFCAGTDRKRRCGGYLVQVAFLGSGNQTSTAGTTQEILDAGCQELCKLTQDLQSAGESQPNSGSWPEQALRCIPSSTDRQTPEWGDCTEICCPVLGSYSSFATRAHTSSPQDPFHFNWLSGNRSWHEDCEGERYLTNV